MGRKKVMKSGRFGVIFGSGLDQESNLFGTGKGKDFVVCTPYGALDFSEFPLDSETSLVSTARHLTGHILLPSEVNYRGIMYAMKTLNVEAVVGISAVGSRRSDIKPGTLVAVDQYIDHTHGRVNSFFGNGLAGHVSFGQPVCPNLQTDLVKAGRRLGITVKDGARLMVMEGPAFSTEAEAQADQALAELIGMTSMPEAKLAREAELCYCTLACVTDYDAGIVKRPPVDAKEVERVFAVIKPNAIAVVSKAAKRFLARENYSCSDRTALDTAIMTDPRLITRERISAQRAILERWDDVHLKK